MLFVDQQDKDCPERIAHIAKIDRNSFRRIVLEAGTDYGQSRDDINGDIGGRHTCRYDSSRRNR